MTKPSSAVGVELLGRIGVLTLNRLSAHNALSGEMVQTIHRALDEWKHTDLAAVLLQSASPRAFCVGGDVRTLRNLSLAGDIESCERLMTAECDLGLRIAELAYPLVTLVDGPAMGGGVSLPVHGCFVVVTERATMAMPETAIGFFPDVGSTHFLSRLAGSLGMYLGLSGATMSAADALYCGLASHFVDSDKVRGLTSALGSGSAPVETTLRAFSGMSAAGGSELALHRDEIDWCFGAPNLDGIYVRLQEAGTAWATAALRRLQTLSRQSLAMTFELIVLGRQRSLRECLETELRLSRDVVSAADFIEGVRAALVDKDREPHWGPSLFLGFDELRRPVWAETPCTPTP